MRDIHILLCSHVEYWWFLIEGIRLSLQGCFLPLPWAGVLHTNGLESQKRSRKFSNSQDHAWSILPRKPWGWMCDVHVHCFPYCVPLKWGSLVCREWEALSEAQVKAISMWCLVLSGAEHVLTCDWLKFSTGCFVWVSRTGRRWRLEEVGAFLAEDHCQIPSALLKYTQTAKMPRQGENWAQLHQPAPALVLRAWNVCEWLAKPYTSNHFWWIWTLGGTALLMWNTGLSLGICALLAKNSTLYVSL